MLEFLKNHWKAIALVTAALIVAGICFVSPPVLVSVGIFLLASSPGFLSVFGAYSAAAATAIVTTIAAAATITAGFLVAAIGHAFSWVAKKLAQTFTSAPDATSGQNESYFSDHDSPDDHLPGSPTPGSILPISLGAPESSQITVTSVRPLIRPQAGLQAAVSHDIASAVATNSATIPLIPPVCSNPPVTTPARSNPPVLLEEDYSDSSASQVRSSSMFAQPAPSTSNRAPTYADALNASLQAGNASLLPAAPTGRNLSYATEEEEKQSYHRLQ